MTEKSIQIYFNKRRINLQKVVSMPGHVYAFLSTVEFAVAAAVLTRHHRFEIVPAEEFKMQLPVDTSGF